jgi:hypothetical protein
MCEGVVNGMQAIQDEHVDRRSATKLLLLYDMATRSLARHTRAGC